MHSAFSMAATMFGVLTVLSVARRPLARWYRKVKRRKGGIYLWRVDHHLNRARRVNGYVGETVSFYFRSRQHLGMSNYAGDGKRQVAPVKVPSQPWSDLNPKMYKVIKLPWWLCWKWVLRPLETVVIMLTWPVYNDAKNRWNPRRITKSQAKLDRLRRDAGSATYVFRTWTAHLARYVLQGVGVLVIATGLIGWMVAR